MDAGRFRALGKMPSGRWARQARLRSLSRKAGKLLKDYGAVLLSGDCLEAARGLPEGARCAYYCHTPPRYLFDRKADYEKKVRPWLRPAFRAISSALRDRWLESLALVPVVLANSQNTRKRLLDFAGRDAAVVHPPVDTDYFHPAEHAKKGGYFLSFARLAHIKRVDAVARAFRANPDLRLVLVHGKNDPQKDEVLALAADCPNIEVRTGVDDRELLALIRGATATVYVPRDEDFGMSPVESMACGTPVLGVAEGGLLETVEHGKTGYLLPAGFADEELAAAARRLAKTAEGMAAACRESALRFSYPEFARKLRAAVRGK